MNGEYHDDEDEEPDSFSSARLIWSPSYWAEFKKALPDGGGIEITVSDVRTKSGKGSIDYILKEPMYGCYKRPTCLNVSYTPSQISQFPIGFEASEVGLTGVPASFKISIGGEKVSLDPNLKVYGVLSLEPITPSSITTSSPPISSMPNPAIQKLYQTLMGNTLQILENLASK